MRERANWSDIGFLALLTATPALATDMYPSAIPTIARQWSSSESVIGLSLVLWFVAFSIFLLVWGPISDRVGRRHRSSLRDSLSLSWPVFSVPFRRIRCN